MSFKIGEYLEEELWGFVSLDWSGVCIVFIEFIFLKQYGFLHLNMELLTRLRMMLDDIRTPNQRPEDARTEGSFFSRPMGKSLHPTASLHQKGGVLVEHW